MTAQGLTESLRETLSVFDDAAPRSTTELAAALDLGRRSTYERLERLVDQGRLETKKVGASARVWWRPSAADSALSADEETASAAVVNDVLDGADVGVFVLDAEFDVVWVNEAIERYFGLDRESVLGRHKPTFVADRIAPVVEDSDRFAETVRSTYDDNDDVEQFECRVTAGEDREERWLEHRSKPIDAGAYAGGRVELYHDVTERKRSERALRVNDLEFETLVDAVEEYAIFTLDADGRVRSWNRGAERFKGYDADDILGQHFSTFYTDEDRGAGVPGDNLATAAETGTATDEGWRVRADGTRFWANVTITAITDEDGDVAGYVKVTRDMTDRREYERQLEAQAERLQRQRDDLESELESVIERVSDGFYALDEDRQFTYVNDRATEQLGIEEADVVGRDIGDVVELTETFEAALSAAYDGQDPVSYEEYYEPLDAWFETTIYPSTSGVSVYSGDVTDRVERERELEESERRYRTLVDNFPNGAVVLFDEDLRYLTVGGEVYEDLDFTAADLEGDRMDERLPEDLYEAIEAPYRAVFDGDRSEFQVEWEGRIRQFRVFPVSDRAGDVFAGMVMSQDITERVERERELESRVSQQAIVTELGRQALESDDLDALFATAAEVVAESLDNDYCKVLDLDDSSEELLLRQGVGWDDGIVGTATVSSVEHDSQAAHTLATEGPIVVEDLTTETRFSGPALLTDHDVRSGISTVIGPHDDPWGILGTHDTAVESFSEHDVQFVQSVANILASAIDRNEGERNLRRQREQLAALNNLNAVVRDITDAVIDQSTREEIEATVCERLAAAESYSFAWIGDVDVASQTVNLRTEAGVEGYLDGITISVDPDDARSQGPTGRALRTGTIQTTQDVDERHDPWREHVQQYDIRSSAASPIVHEESTYGVLNVYADRPNAFGGAERTVIAQLGEVVGHAIAAAERKQALVSDEVVAVEFRIPRLFEALSVPADTDGRITLDQVVSLPEEEFIVYGTATPDAVDAVRAIAATLPHWTSVTFHTDGDPSRFELRLSDPPALTTVASLGGSVERAVIEGGDLRMRVHLAPGADVRRLKDAIQGEYPSIEMLNRRQITRARDGDETFQRLLSEDLTDRQRAALEAAYYAGFFEWPRTATGEDVADSLDVSAPTFHQHLRKAEQKVLGALLDEPL
jgi:PAS domain S-box-containing protein